MRLFLEAEPGELEERGDELVKHLADMLGPFNPILEEAFQKALPSKEPELKFKVLRQLKAETSDEYAKTLKQMVADIGKVLDTAAAKTTLKKAAGLAPSFEKPEPGEEEDDEPEEPLEPGDYDPKTDSIVPEPEDEDEEGEEEEAEKAMGYDRSQPIVDADAKRYEQVKAEMIAGGYMASDFTEGGPFYGWSVNQLVEFMRDKRRATDASD